MWIRIPQPQPIFEASIYEFNGNDPWTGHRQAPWLLGLYKLGIGARSRPVDAPPLRPRDEFPAGYVLGLFSRHTNKCRLIPYSLRCQWQQGNVQPEDLAPLLHRAEQTRSVDDEIVPLGEQLRIQAILQTVVGAPLAVAVPFLWWTRHPEAALMCGFIGAICIGLAVFGWLRHWLWRRRQERLSRQWLRLLDEL